jgi:hypothetical protein
MAPVDLHLKAMDVLDVALAGRPDPAALRELVGADLEVLEREDLVRLVAVVVADVSLAIGPRTRPDVRRRLGRMRLEAMWQGSE